MRFIKSKVFGKNILLAFFLYIMLIFFSWQIMKIFTHHGKTVIVPDFSGLSVVEVNTICDSLKLSYEIIDSAAFNVKYPRGSIINQIPAPFFEVKEGRVMYLTVNPSMPRLVLVPNVVDMPKRQAVSYLEKSGFRIGRFDYLPDLGRDVVLAIKFQEKEIKAGNKLRKLSKIDLVLGDGLSLEKIPIPNLIGLRLDSAKLVLQELTLNLGNIRYDSVMDSLSIFIYKQRPISSRGLIRRGAYIDIWLTNH